MTLPNDYTERVYAGVLGKLIGVYLGRPIEGMLYRDILTQLGEIQYYVHEQRNVPLVVSDDDISGTFTFLRALEDHNGGVNLSAEEVGRTWLNYIIENKSILWWGGVGTSTEHTAYKRLRDGIPAPRSGSIELNSKVVAEQIGAQIFIDGWAMVAPGNPDLAADLAGKAASASHDGEAVHAARLLASMEARAFVESDLSKLLDLGLGYVPRDSVIRRMIDDLRGFHASNNDWRKAMTDVMEKHYGYDRYGGNCHVVPNHGIIILALLYGEDSFQNSMMIANTCGWDTDCNSGNVGCLMGIKNGLAGIGAGPDWRSPVADRLYLPTADGGSCITDAARETIRIVNMGRRLAGEKAIAPKDGARFHFSLPGSVQGWTLEESPESRGTAVVTNGGGKLSITTVHLAPGRVARAFSPTFITPEAAKVAGYALTACPTLYSGQQVTASLMGDAGNTAPLSVSLYLQHYGPADTLVRVYGPRITLAPGQSSELSWTIPQTDGQPIGQIGVEVATDRGGGTIHLDRLDWSGEPTLTLAPPTSGGDMWRKAWVEGVNTFSQWGLTKPGQAFSAIQNDGRGLAIHGTRQWKNYTVSASLTPHLAKVAGLAARVQGMRRYYALILRDDQTLRLVKMLDEEKMLAEIPFEWKQNESTIAMSLTVKGNRITASADGKLLEAVDEDQPLLDGAIALLIEEGRLCSGPVAVRAIRMKDEG